MQSIQHALAGANGKGDWTARIEDGDTIYRHESGLETRDRSVVEASLDWSGSGLGGVS